MLKCIIIGIIYFEVIINKIIDKSRYLFYKWERGKKMEDIKTLENVKVLDEVNVQSIIMEEVEEKIKIEQSFELFVP